MKTLRQHISEKLIINKDFEKCLCNEPKSNGGLFLQLYINSCKNGKNNRIDISVEEYTFKNNIFKDSEGPYKKNEKGYYWTDERFDGYWITLALIADDALDFLDTLSDEIEHEDDINYMNYNFNSSKYFDRSQEKLIHKVSRKVRINGKYKVSKDFINNAIKIINEDID